MFIILLSLLLADPKEFNDFKDFFICVIVMELFYFANITLVILMMKTDVQ